MELPCKPEPETSVIVPEPFGRSLPIAVKLLSEAGSLVSLEKDFEFFSHGVYIIHGKLTCDPVQRFFEEFRQNRQPYMLASERPIFKGISPIFDKLLTVVDKDCWPELKRYLDTVVIVDERRKFYAKAVRQTIPMFDFYELDRPGIVEPPFPMLNITTYSITSNRGLFHFKPAVMPGEAITLVRDEPETKVLEEANRAFLKNGDSWLNH